VVSRGASRLAALLLAFAAGVAQAGVGLLEMPARGETGPITVFYPTAQEPTTVDRGPFHLKLAPNAAPMKGNGRLIVLSHGSGGNAWVHTDLATQLVEAGFVVASPLHRGDNFLDTADVGPATWKRRPVEVSRTIDAIAAEPRLAPLLSLDRVGMFGMSAGGHTALTLAGGRWSPSALVKHCESHIDDDFASCVGLAMQLHGNWLDGPKKQLAMFAIRRRLDDGSWYSHTDPRLAAIVAEVPFAVDFDLASLAQPVAPLGLVRNGRDAWLPAVYHLDPVLRTCRSCELVSDLPTAGHGSLLSPQPVNLPPAAEPLLRDPPGFDRKLVAPAHARIVGFFRARLLP
jgi:predicted dienelactone hydrolase